MQEFVMEQIARFETQSAAFTSVTRKQNNAANLLRGVKSFDTIDDCVPPVGAYRPKFELTEKRGSQALISPDRKNNLLAASQELNSLTKKARESSNDNTGCKTHTSAMYETPSRQSIMADKAQTFSQMSSKATKSIFTTNRQSRTDKIDKMSTTMSKQVDFFEPNMTARQSIAASSAERRTTVTSYDKNMFNEKKKLNKKNLKSL